MYATRARTEAGSRSASLGAAIAVNGALIAAIISAAPDVVPGITTVLIGKNIPLEKPPEAIPDPLPTTTLPSTTTTLAKPDPQPKPDTSATLLPDAGTAFPVGGEIIDQPLPPPPPPQPIPSVTPTPVLVGVAPDPRFADRLQPSYPPSLMRLGEEGEVTLRVLIGADGRVKAAEKVAATNEDFWAATKRQALARWRFKPATRDGVPVESWYTTKVRFVID